ncbi:hypothetical protein HPULCUR_002829 [Helicostylum pulchrum]|uniref:Uncharacterized protein n=1 Tax=Helicostylum pulchrum TaxID=562976 RepID=A0ABP9XRN4_9FUNG
MQLDEDVGKVAQATPILISKALEKKTIESVDQFDFLKDIVSEIPDPLETRPSDNRPKPVRATRNPRAMKEE